MLSSLIQTAVTALQFFVSVANSPELDVATWGDPLQALSFANLDIVFIRRFVPLLEDPRLYFFTVCIALPMVLVLAGVYFLNPVRVSAWYMTLLVGITLIAGGIMTIVGTQGIGIDTPLGTGAGGGFLVAGLLLVLLCAGLFAFREDFACLDEDGGGQVRELAQHNTRIEKILRTEKIAWPTVVIRVVFGLVLLGLGLGCWFGPGGYDSNETALVGTGWFQQAIAIALWTVGLPVLVWGALGLVYCGRVVQWHVGGFLERYFMRGLLLAISLVYVPVGSGAITMFNCSTFTCPPGMRLIDEGSNFPRNLTRYDTVVRGKTTNPYPHCAVCTLGDNQTCPSPLQQALCAGSSASRLESDVSLTCKSLQTFFWPASGLVFLGFCIGVPIMFWYLIRLVSSLVMEKFPVKIPAAVDANDDDAVWALKVNRSENVARFLYQPFQPNHRYARLYLSMQQLVVVVTSVFIIRVGDIKPTYWAVGAALVIHLASFGWLLLSRPFMWRLENVLAPLVEVCLVFASIVALAATAVLDVPTWVFWAVLGVNVLVPVLTVAIGVVLEWSAGCGSDGVDEEAIEKEVQEEMQRRKLALASNTKFSPRGGATADPEKNALRQPTNPQGKDAHPALRTARMARAELGEQEPEEFELSQKMEQNRQRQYSGQQIAHESSMNRPTAPLDFASMSPPPTLPPKDTSPGDSKQRYRTGSSDGPIGGIFGGYTTTSPTDNRSGGFGERQARLIREKKEQKQKQEAEKQQHEANANRGWAVPAGQQSASTDGSAFSPTESGPSEAASDAIMEEQVRGEVLERWKAKHSKLTAAQENTDATINHTVRAHLSGFLMAFGAFCFVATGCAVVGILERSVAAPIAPDEATMTTAKQLAGRASFKQFTDECCCTFSFGQGNATYQAMEKWVCSDGALRERLRVKRVEVPRAASAAPSAPTQYRDISSLDIRPLCGTAFSPACSLNVSTSGAVQLGCIAAAGFTSEQLGLW